MARHNCYNLSWKPRSTPGHKRILAGYQAMGYSLMLNRVGTTCALLAAVIWLFSSTSRCTCALTGRCEICSPGAVEAPSDSCTSSCCGTSCSEGTASQPDSDCCGAACPCLCQKPPVLVAPSSWSIDGIAQPCLWDSEPLTVQPRTGKVVASLDTGVTLSLALLCRWLK